MWRSTWLGIAGAALALAACRGPREDGGERAGHALGAVLAQGLREATKVEAPWPCVAPATGEPEAPPGWVARPGTLALAQRREVVSLGFVADGAGGSAATLENLRRAAAAFAEQEVVAVVSLGGHASERDELAAMLEALSDERYLLVAGPGDLETTQGHRAAVRALAERGRRVADALEVRLLELAGQATVALAPGARGTTQSPAGVDGCELDDSMADELAGQLERAKGLRIWASWAAPRGPHVTQARGDARLGRALLAHHVELAIVGEPTDLTPATGQGRAGAPLEVVATGFLDGAPRLPVAGRPPAPTALLLRIEDGRWSWRRLELVAR